MKIDQKPDNYLRDEDTPENPFEPLPDPSERFDGKGQSLWRRPWVKWGIVIVVAGLFVAFYLRYMTPYVVESRQKGYITNVERRGLMFRTFEGEMVSEASINDSTRLYTRDFTFSVPDDSLARELQKLQGTGRPVVVYFKKYYGTLPWRGSSTNIITSIARE